MRKQSSDQPFIASCPRKNVPKSSRTSPDMRVFDRLIDTSCSSPTEFQFGGRRNLRSGAGWFLRPVSPPDGPRICTLGRGTAAVLERSPGGCFRRTSSFARPLESEARADARRFLSIGRQQRYVRPISRPDPHFLLTLLGTLKSGELRFERTVQCSTSTPTRWRSPSSVAFRASGSADAAALPRRSSRHDPRPHAASCRAGHDRRDGQQLGHGEKRRHVACAITKEVR
jgi:hypothetical protein